MKKQKRQTQPDELMDIARPVIARLDGLWFAAFTEMVVAEIENLRNPDVRARVEAAGRIAHECAAKTYCAVYRKVLREVMDASA